MFAVKRFLKLFLLTVSFLLVLATPINAQRRDNKPKPRPKPTAPTVKSSTAVGLAAKFQVDSDRLTSQVSGGVADKVRISLSEAGADWCGALKVVDKNGAALWIERQEGVASTTNVVQLDRNRFGSEIKIEFWKAKLFGVHTYMTSETYKIDDFVGKTVTFTWNEGLAKNDDGAPKPVNSAPINGTVKIDGAKDVTVKTTDNLKDGQLDRGMVKFRMDTAKGVTWWKCIKVIDSRGSAMLIEKQDGKYSTTDVIEIDRGRLPKTVKIELWTAKFLGAHTYMKTLTYDAERLNGRTLTITYKAD